MKNQSFYNTNKTTLNSIENNHQFIHKLNYNQIYDLIKKTKIKKLIVNNK